MTFNAAFNNISVIPEWSVLLVEEAGVPSRSINLRRWISQNNLASKTNHKMGDAIKRPYRHGLHCLYKLFAINAILKSNLYKLNCFR